ncbi:DEAD/DEAH box helicase family protein [Micromonospora sp. NPDC023814]|uniref:DEAD/DEAH box helicase family protein n=2 Tax=unclassified Micromonospora TaxID=2617518 RepID=UPI0033FEFFC1
MIPAQAGKVTSLADVLPSDSFLEWAFLRWVLTPAASQAIVARLRPQAEVTVDGRTYRLDYEIRGDELTVAVELDGFTVHGTRAAFTYDRLRQNDLMATGRAVVRFSYDAIRSGTARCVAQLQALLTRDPALALLVSPDPHVEAPDMAPDPIWALAPSPRAASPTSSGYFVGVRSAIEVRTLRECQKQAFAALGNYYGSGGTKAACVMSVGAGKTVLGVVAALAFSRRRALVVTPGNVIRGTFDRAFDHQAPGNALYGLPGGPLIPGRRPPVVRVLDRDTGGIRRVTREQLLAADVIVTNFHSLGTGGDPDDLLAKLTPGDVDMIVVDEAHIAAAESYQRLFSHFAGARSLLMSACFTRLDGKPIDADVVYRYRLIDSIADGNAKNLRVLPFVPDTAVTTYELVWPGGRREEIVGRDALLAVLGDERKLSRITARSTEPIRQVMRAVASALDAQRELLFPVKPRVLFAAMGQAHAEQISRIANEHGIACDVLHHSMTDAQIKRVRERFESDAGDLDAVVQLRMLGQGYDFPPICVVVPMRPYGSFSEFYQFIGRGIRVLLHPALIGRVGPEQQFLDVVLHAELGLDEHLDTLYAENDMDPVTGDAKLDALPGGTRPPLPGTTGGDEAARMDAFVLFERGEIASRVVYDADRVETRRAEREREALAARYAAYAASTADPVTFEQYVEVMRGMRD